MSYNFEPATHPEPPRDRWQRPLIIPPDGGKPTAYTRCTTYVDVLEDKYNLQKWMQRMVAVGLAQRPDLHLAAASMAADPQANKRDLDGICEQAVEAARGTAKATTGTALHAYVERINRGVVDLGPVPTEYQRHLDAYRAATAGFTPLHVERFVVQDQLRVGGTPDLIAQIDGLDGLVVVDLKTGPSTLKYGALKVAMQLAMYSHSCLYAADTGQRAEIEGLRTDIGVVVALNSETDPSVDADAGKCELHLVDLSAGWEAVQVATQVREWRKRKGLLRPAELPSAALPAALTAPAAPVVDAHQLDRALTDAIADAASREALLDLWSRAGEAWGEHHTAAATQRLAQLAA